MTLEEINAFLKSSRYVECERDDWDGCDNHWAASIYENNGELYRVEFLNQRPLEDWGEKGHIRGSYTPVKVIAKTRTVEETYYEEINSDIHNQS